MDPFTAKCQNIYNYLHAKRMSKRLGGKWPAKIKNWDKVYNKPEWPHIQRIQRLIQESDNKINYRDLIDAAFEFNKDGWVVANNLYSPQYIKIYKEYMKRKEDDNNPEKIKEGIIRSTKFVIRVCKANKFKTLDEYLLAEDEFVPLVIDHYEKGLITKPFFYMIPNLYNIGITYEDNIVNNYFKDKKLVIENNKAFYMNKSEWIKKFAINISSLIETKISEND